MIKFQSHQKIKYFLFAIIFSLLLPLPSCALTDVSLIWSPNSESDLSGYKVFSRIAGEAYDYSEPAWEGTDTSCTISIYGEEIPYYFVARAFNVHGDESENSDEVCYKFPNDTSEDSGEESYLYGPDSGGTSENTDDSGCFIRGLLK